MNKETSVMLETAEKYKMLPSFIQERILIVKRNRLKNKLNSDSVTEAKRELLRKKIDSIRG